MNKSKKNILNRFKSQRFWMLAFFISLAFNFHSLWSPLAADNAREGSQKYQYILQTLLHYMDTYYVEDVSQEKLLEGAVRGLLKAGGDRYTRFMNATEMKQFMGMEGGNRIGIGVELIIESGEPYIIAPMKGGPAWRAGIKAGDIITTINSTKTKGLTITDLSGLITGKMGTSVLLKIRRNAFPEEIEIDVIRGEFQMDYVHTKYLKKEQLGYIQLTHFFGEQSGSVKKFKESMTSFQRKKVRGVILDLRNNTGGHLDMAGVLTGLFLKKGDVVVRSRGRFKQWNRVMKANDISAGQFQKVPLVVLVNGSSASASEIMAGALQDHGRARLIGEQTFGKASVQRIFRSLPGNVGALITIQKYFTPKDRGIHGKGLKPDIIVASLKPSREENLYYYQMNKAKFMESFKKKYPEYKSTLPEIFQKEALLKKWKFSRPFAIRLLRSNYHTTFDLVQLEVDPQLKRAIEELTGKSLSLSTELGGL